MQELTNGFFGEVITAIVTPMRETGEIDFEKAAELAIHLIKNGSDSLVISGTTGEAPATHINEKGELIRIIKSALKTAFPEKKIPLIAGTGSNDTAHVIRNAEIAYESGADAQLVVTPYYSRPSQLGIIKHFEQIFENSKLPVILYDVPGRTGVKLSEETYLKLCENEKVVAIKDATGDVYQASKTISKVNRLRKDKGQSLVTLYSGDDSLLLQFLAIGAKGVISVASHIIGDVFKEVVNLFNSGKIVEARNLFVESSKYIDLLNSKGQQAATSKAALQALGILDNRFLRLPNFELELDEFENVKREIEGLKYA